MQQKRTGKALPGAEVIPFELGAEELFSNKEAPEHRNFLGYAKLGHKSAQLPQRSLVPWCIGISTFKQLTEALDAKDAFKTTNLPTHPLKVLDTHKWNSISNPNTREGVCSISVTWVLLGANQVR